MTVGLQDSALSGPVNFSAVFTLGDFSGSPFTAELVQEPSNCPSAFGCHLRVLLDGIQPGETASLAVFNTAGFADSCD